MNAEENDFPLSIQIGFSKLFDKYRALNQDDNAILSEHIQKVLEIADTYPALSNGIESKEDVEEYKEQIDYILRDLFSPILLENEIKIATVPYRDFIFKSTRRFDTITEVAGDNLDLEFTDFSDDQAYIMGCSIILNAYYGYRIDFRRPFYYQIPDAQGILRYYKALYNGDFVAIEKTDKAVDITPEDVSELIDNFDNIAIWKEKFPPKSWTFKGFVIANLYDATIDVSLSNFKATLIRKEANDENFVTDFRTIIRAIFNLPDLEIGYAIFNQEEDTFESPPISHSVNSYILAGKQEESCRTALCEYSYAQLVDKHDIYSVSNVDKFATLYPDNVLYQKLVKQDIQSVIIAPLVDKDSVMGVMEIVSKKPEALNTINAHKLQDIMPYLVDSVKRSKEREENDIELMIQAECTSIHPSVHWKFKKEAYRVLKAQQRGEEATFQEVVFENVHPLFGQIDIKGSSEARNVATKDDLILQLRQVRKIIHKISVEDPLPIYEHLTFRIDSFLDEIKDLLQVNSERQVLNFLKNEIIPLYDHIKKKNASLKELVEDYYQSLDRDKGFIYKNRKQYDDSVMLINKTMAAVLDKKQKKAQKMYPHYYERFKTDGVEHNLYIGGSITKSDSFHKIYLYNLRLWQLQAMCEMENRFYKLKETLPVPLDVASMILAFNTPLSLRFRMDEKRFDVDGTYNARYEVVKKRVDKAHIKGTDERITQPGKISIIYSQTSDEREYIKYIQFLQSKKQLGTSIEILELEDLQGVTGLKAIRVNVLYNRGEKEKEYYTYEDLLSEIDKS